MSIIINNHTREIITFTKIFNRHIKGRKLKCPECESILVLNDNKDCVDRMCLSHHPNDIYSCLRCQWKDTASSLLDLFINKQNEVICPCCNGSGFVVRQKRINFRAAFTFWKANKKHKE